MKKNQNKKTSFTVIENLVFIVMLFSITTMIVTAIFQIFQNYFHIFYSVFFIGINLEMYIEVKKEGKGLKHYLISSGLFYGYWGFLFLLVVLWLANN